MSTKQQKAKTTLAKKLKAKQLEPEYKPELFIEVKNNRTTTAAPSKHNDLQKEGDEIKRTRIKSKVKAGQDEDNCVIETKKVRSITRKKNIEVPSLEVLSETKKTHTKHEPPISSGVSKTTNKIETEKGAKNEQETLLKFKEETFENKWEPNNWLQILDNIRQMRSKDNAPVDTMGCHKCADENADEKTQRFHKLVALMLSSQTKDETTYHAMLRLREHTLTPETINEMKTNVLEQILHPVSFYKNKAKYLQQTSRILIDKYSSDIPNNIKELVSLPGVGPKMAHICMATAWHETTGIGVDVHVHRICNRMKWVPRPTKEPEQTRTALESWLPRELWKEVNHLLVGFGQTTCTPLKPKCSVCLNCDICPAAPKPNKVQEKRENKEVTNICDKAKFKKLKMHV